MSDRPYLRDQAERLTDETDAFGHRDYAAALTHPLTEAEPPFTVGLFGAWGIGKSTILGEVRNRVRAAGSTYVYFDAWRYEGEAFRREFLKDVAKKLKKDGALKKSFKPEEELRDFYTSRATPDDQMTVSKTHALRATIAWVVVLAVVYLGGLLSVEALTAPRNATDPAVLAFLGLLPLIIFLLNRTTDVIQVKQNVITRQKLEEPERFTERFGALLRAVGAKRVVIAIDNLDRLSADDAVALLSTVKTYLEPVIEDDKEPPTGDVVFLIAADDAALREHLMTRAPRVLDGQRDVKDRQKAERYADEYLRKFFNTSMSLRPVLDDDIRDYMRKHLAALARRWEQSNQLDDLVRLCAAGLRHNPRRVKQFVNNLELRLQLIRARETAGASHASKIVPAISGQLAVVAKLALIEEEWAQRFEEMRNRPSRLREWNELASRKETPEQREDSDWDEFAAFLRASRHVAIPNLRPFLRLKLSAVEAALPRYDEFHDAITTPRPAETLSPFFDDVSDEICDRYADRLADVAEEELKAGNLDAAVAVVDAAVSVEQLAARATARTRVLTFAVTEPDLRAAIVQVSPKPLVAATRDLSNAAQEAVHGVLVSAFLAEATADSTELAEALAAVAGEFAPHVAESVRTGLDEDDRPAAFAHYLPLVEARPDLLPSTAATSAFEALTKAQVDEKPRLREAGPAWSVVKVAMTTGVLAAGDEDAVVDHLIQVLTLADGDDVVTHIADIRNVVPVMNQAAPDAWQRLVAHLIQSLPSIPPETLTASTELAVELLDRVPAEQRPQLVPQLAQQMFAQGSFGIDYASEHAAELPADLCDVVTGLLEQQLQQGQLPAAGALLTLDPDGGAARIAAAAVQAATGSNHDLVTGLLDSHPTNINERRAEMAGPVISRLEQPQAPQATAPDVELLLRLLPGLNDEQRERVATLVTGYIQQQPQPSPAQGAIDKLLDGVAQDQGFEKHLKSVFEQLSGQLGQPTVGALRPTLSVLVAHFDKLERAQREQVLERLQHWLQHDRQEAVYLASLARQLPGLPATPADDLVRALIQADLAEDAAATDTRVALAAAVQAVAGASKGKRVAVQRDTFLERLRTGEDRDRAVYERVMDAQQTAE